MQAFKNQSYFFLVILLFISSDILAQNVQLKSSNLPLFIVDTHGQSIKDEPKIEADLNLIDHNDGTLNLISDVPNEYQGKIGIELRGSYSQSLPQKPYGFETLNSDGVEENISLLGFPKENDWILLANYNDKSFVRNSLIFELFTKMGHYAPRTKHCEVIVNNEYRGIYVFTEKIKRDKNRVDIPKLDSDDNAGDSLTGGYIFKIDYSDGNDYWISEHWPDGYRKNSVRFIYTYPEPDEITSKQKTYLQNYVNEFEDVLYSDAYSSKENGYQQFIDLRSFIDYFIIGEVTRNVDAYKKSCHYYKQINSKGGLIYAGPVWDFDWAMKNFSECIYRNTDGSGWAYKIHECNPNPVPPDWMVRLLSDPNFKNKAFDRYFQLRENILSEASIFSYIDSVAMLLDDAQERHYQKWPILGKNVGTPEVDVIPKTFNGEIEKLKDWLTIRLAWLDDNMPGEPSAITNLLIGDSSVEIFPNPVYDQFTVVSVEKLQKIEVLNFNGQVVKNFNCNSTKWEGSLSGLNSGIYFLRIQNHIGQTTMVKIVKR
ncbi:MAG: CotH kinase family protein [Prolixibacteraceae bacterium]